MSNKPLQVFRYDHCRYLVASEEFPHTKLYLVDLIDWGCSCPDFGIRKATVPDALCKHIRRCLPVFAVDMLKDIRHQMKHVH